MKKILVLQDWYFPGFKAGEPIKCIRNIVNNSKDEFSFYILTNNKDFGEKISFKNIKENKWSKKMIMSMFFIIQNLLFQVQK